MRPWAVPRPDSTPVRFTITREELRLSSIVKEKNGRYRARYRDPNGRSKSVTFDRLEDARRFLSGVGGDLLRGDYIDPSQARARFEDWAEAWWESTSGLRPSSRCSYRARLDRHVLPYFKGRRVGSIDYADVELWLADRRKAGLGPSEHVCRYCHWYSALP